MAAMSRAQMTTTAFLEQKSKIIIRHSLSLNTLAIQTEFIENNAPQRDACTLHNERACMRIAQRTKDSNAVTMSKRTWACSMSQSIVCNELESMQIEQEGMHYEQRCMHNEQECMHNGHECTPIEQECMRNKKET
jgi:hypothetical protein